MDTLLYEQIEDLVAPLICFSILIFFVLVGFLAVFIYRTFFCNCYVRIDEDGNKVQLSDNDVTQNIKTEIKSLRGDIVSLNNINNVSYSSLSDDTELKDLIVGSILELNNRLNLVEIEIKKNKKVGRKNDSKN